MYKDRGSILRLIFVVMTTCLMSHISISAQPKSLGATFSFTGIALSYEHGLNKTGSFIEASIKAETSEIFLYRTVSPGISGSITWNFPIKEWTSDEGNKLTFFAGPGLTIGCANDYNLPYGAFFGLKGRVGVECNFARNVVISACFSPVIGSHIVFYSDHLTMRHYKNGLMYSLIPEIGIKYRF